MTNIWNASIQSSQGDQYVIKDMGWDGFIAPGQSVDFGFNGSNSANMNLGLSNVVLNGVTVET